MDLVREKKLHESILGLLDKKLIKSAHDVSEGGIICALAECCIINEENKIGASVEMPIKSRTDFSLFSESQSRVLISINPGNKNDLEEHLSEIKQSFIYLGKTGGNNLNVNGIIKIDVERLGELYYNTIPQIMNE
jgi:phosphoribosylformylglycinamidine synthase